MKIEILVCDVCGARSDMAPTGWEYNFHGGDLNIVPDGTNGMRKLEHLCRDCRCVIHGSIIKAIKSRASQPSEDV